MISEGSKRIVVIKDINSNIIEEAILVLKSGPVAAWEKNKGKNTNDVTGNAPDFLLKEAEVIIDDYLKENKTLLQIKTRRENKKKFPKSRFKTGLIINIAFIVSAVILFLLLRKLV